MTANASLSSATDPLELDLVASGRLGPIPAALIEGRDCDLIHPVRFLAPGELPTGEGPRVDRRALAATLAEANAEYGHPRAAELGEQLADPAVRVVVTGQQPGLFGGPLLTATKMIAAVLWAEALTRAGQPAVPVFWVATEDHDWTEATRTAVLTPDGPRKYDLGPDPDPLRPLGARTYPLLVRDLARRIESELGFQVAASRFSLVHRWYRPGARFGEALSGLMIHLLGARAPLMLDASLRAIKHLERPWLDRLVERRSAVSDALTATGEGLRRRDYPLQVRPQPGASPLFLLVHGERRRVLWHSGHTYTLRGCSDPPAAVEDLQAIIYDDPARVSAGVLARPVIQDALLGTTLQVMGGAEVSYLAQAAPLYQVLGVEPPWATLRPHVVLIEERLIGHLEELRISLPELYATPPDQLLADKLGADFVSPVRHQVERLIATLHGPAVTVDATLERPWEKTRDQVHRALEQFGAKVSSAVARRSDVRRQRLGRLYDVCLPEGHLQERYYSVAQFLAHYGAGFADAYWTQMRRDPRPLQVLRPPPAADTSAGDPL